jgi:hypothetical protein
VTSAAPNIVDHPKLYEVLVCGGVNGVVSPGTCTLEGHDRAEKWDVKEGDGKGGATTTHKGEEVTTFSATFYIWKDRRADHFAQWDVFRAFLRQSIATKPPTAFDVYHPDLAENDIKSVQVKKIYGKKYDGLGGATCKVDFIEYRPPAPKGGTPQGSSADPAGGSGDAGAQAPDPNADAKAAFEEELAKAREP